jgi:hypothetical protein
MACKRSLFWCRLIFGDCELAAVEMTGGCKTRSLLAGRLILTRDASSVRSKMLGERVWGVFGGKRSVFSTFSTFGLKSADF